MQADFVAAGMDALHQSTYGGMLGLVVGILAGVGTATDEVESADQSMALGNIHDPVEGIDPIRRMQRGPGLKPYHGSLQHAFHVPAYQYVARHAADDSRRRGKAIAAGHIHVMRHLHAGPLLPELQFGP
ncbi:hypothetical protein D3C72_1856590 [compost metagenome]